MGKLQILKGETELLIGVLVKFLRRKYNDNSWHIIILIIQDTIIHNRFFFLQNKDFPAQNSIEKSPNFIFQ